MTFDSLVRRSGKGLDVSKELVIALELNLGGTLGTQYFADKNLTVEGTYYDGRLISASTVNRNIFPDVGSFEISNLEVQLANQDNEFRNPKWVRWSHGKPARLRIAFHGTRSLQQADFTTRYNGLLEDITYDTQNHNIGISFQEKTNRLLNTYFPPNRIEEGDFPGRDTELTTVGQPLPYIYGSFTAQLGGPAFFSSIPGILVGTYTNGTSKILFADHTVSLCSPLYKNGVEISQGTPWFYNTYKGGTISTYGSPVCYTDIKGDAGTHVISAGIRGFGTYASNMVKHILHTIGFTDSDLGTLSFDETQETEPTYRNRAYFNESRLVKDVLDDLCFQSGYCLYHDSEGKINIKKYKYAHEGKGTYFNDGDEELGTRELDEDDFTEFYAYKDAQHVINKSEMLYHWSPYMGLYQYYGLIDQKASQTRLDYTREKKIESYWLSGTAAYFISARRIVNRFQYPIYKAKFKLPMSALPLELGDYAQITHPDTPNEYGTQGWKEKNFEIVGLNEYYNDKTVQCEVWEWGIPIPSWKLKTWLSLAEGEGTRLYDEFRELYDYGPSRHRWNTNGTVSSYWDNKVNNDYVITLNGSDQFLWNPQSTIWQYDGSPLSYAEQGVKGAFIKPDNLDTKMCIMSCNRLGTRGWEMGIDTDGSIYYAQNNSAVGPEFTYNSPAAVISGPGTWQGIHVGHCNPGSGPGIWCNFYLDGTQIGTFVNMVGSSMAHVASGLSGIGASNLGTWIDGTTITGVRYFAGQIGDPVFYIKGTRSAANMEKLFDGLRGRYGL